MFKIYRTNKFEKQLRKLPKTEQKEIENFERKISINPFVGKPIYSNFLREKKLNGKRVYYLVYGENKIVLMAAISNKKKQQEEIDDVKKQLENYKDHIREKQRQS